MMIRKAMCCCGACAIQVKGDPTINAVCHCRNCQRRTGSAFGWSAYFPNEAVTATIGAFRTYSPRGKAPGTGQAEWQERVFCGKCGTTTSPPCARVTSAQCDSVVSSGPASTSSSGPSEQNG